MVAAVGKSDSDVKMVCISGCAALCYQFRYLSFQFSKTIPMGTIDFAALRLHCRDLY